jgi:hypothetical protein
MLAVEVAVFVVQEQSALAEQEVVGAEQIPH